MRVEIPSRSRLKENDILRVVKIQDGYFDVRTLRVGRSAVMRIIPPEFLERELAEAAAIRSGSGEGEG